MKQTPGTIRNLIVKELHKHTGVPVIPEYEINKAPKYPYITYKISTPYDNTRNPIIKTTDVPGTNGFDKDTQETLYTQPKLHMTINAHSQDDIEAIECAKSAMDWLMHKGRVELEDSNIVVVETGNIIDKTIHIINNYEQRFGFDVEIRYTDIVENTMDTIDAAGLKVNIKRADESLFKTIIIDLIKKLRGKE